MCFSSTTRNCIKSIYLLNIYAYKNNKSSMTKEPPSIILQSIIIILKKKNCLFVNNTV